MSMADTTDNLAAAFDEADPATWAVLPAEYRWVDVLDAAGRPTGEEHLVAPDGHDVSAAAWARITGDDYGLEVVPARGALDNTTSDAEARAAAMAYAPAAPADLELDTDEALALLELDARWLALRAPVEGLRLGRRRFLAAGDVRTAAVADRALAIATGPEHGPHLPA